MSMIVEVIHKHMSLTKLALLKIKVSMLDKKQLEHLHYTHRSNAVGTTASARVCPDP